MADLAVIIVTWNVENLIREALRSLLDDLAAHGPDAEVWVLDNASADGTVSIIESEFPQVRLIASLDNLGFGRGNNRVLAEIGFGRLPAESLPKAVYLLNPDTITQARATSTLYDALFAEPGLGLVGAQLAYEDGSFQHSAFHFPGLGQLWIELFPFPGRLYESAVNGRYPREVYAAGIPFAIDFPLGATMMMRREVVLQTDGFDERFFMYCEEIDWAWRIHRAGWAVKCVPGAHVVHLEGKSTGQVRPQSIVNLWRSRLQLYARYYPAWKLWLARQLVILGIRRKIRQLNQDETLDPVQHRALADAYGTVCSLVNTSLE